MNGHPVQLNTVMKYCFLGHNATVDLNSKLLNHFLVVIRHLPSSDDAAPLRHLLLRRDLIPVAHLHGDQQVLDQEADLQVDEKHLR